MKLQQGCAYVHSPLYLLALSHYLGLSLETMKELNVSGLIREDWINGMENKNETTH